MRFTILTAFFLAAVVCGCDATGLRRVDLWLPARTSERSGITVDSPDIQAALQILDNVAVQHGFHRAETESGCIHVYAHPPVRVKGRVYPAAIPCRVSLTATGLEVSFGEFGLLPDNPLAAGLFTDVRTAFIQRFGRHCVRSHM